jgi:hypothetical protein
MGGPVAGTGFAPTARSRFWSGRFIRDTISPARYRASAALPPLLARKQMTRGFELIPGAVGDSQGVDDDSILRENSMKLIPPNAAAY